MTKLFVGINFSNKGLLSRKIFGFRKRFDPKFNHYSFAHMAMLAPFEIYDDELEDLTENLKEEIDSFFYDKKNGLSLSFTGVGVHEHKRKKLLYLNPNYCSDLDFCSEAVVDICKSFIPKSIKYKENKKQFLPLGVFYHDNDLIEVMECAQVEFKNNSELPIQSISLYENKFGIWVEREVLFSFEENQSPFLNLGQQHI